MWAGMNGEEKIALDLVLVLLIIVFGLGTLAALGRSVYPGVHYTNVPDFNINA